jgi:hypothetical protein
MSNRFSTFDNRLVFENSKQMMLDAGVDPTTATLTQSTIRLEQTLLTTQSNYTFAPLVNDNGPAGTKFNTEIRLNQQDAMVTSVIAFRLGLPSGATDTTFIGHTYPNPVVFTTGAAQLGTIYNSQLRITVNNVVKFPTLHMGRFRYVPFAQQATAAANQNGIAQDAIDETSDGVMICEPNLVLIGSKNNIINLVLPSSLTTVDAGTRAILEFRGVLAQNVTIIT